MTQCKVGNAAHGAGENGESLMQFPCDFSLKVFGLESDHFEQHVLEILRQFCHEETCFKVNKSVSSKGKYQSLNITFKAESREQMDQIYQALKDSEHVVMSL